MFAHGKGFKLGQLLLDHSLGLFSIFVSAFLVDRINLSQFFMGDLVSLFLHWGSCLDIGGGLLRYQIPTAKVTPIHSLEPPTSQVLNKTLTKGVAVDKLTLMRKISCGLTPG